MSSGWIPRRLILLSLVMCEFRAVTYGPITLINSLFYLEVFCDQDQQNL